MQIPFGYVLLDQVALEALEEMLLLIVCPCRVPRLCIGVSAAIAMLLVTRRSLGGKGVSGGSLDVGKACTKPPLMTSAPPFWKPMSPS